MNEKLFVLRSLLYGALLIAISGGFMYAVDPYAIFGSPTIAGFNRDKTRVVDRSRLAKPYLVERAHPATIVVDSSSVEAGLDPDSPSWPAALKPVFNLGITGSGPYTQLRFLQDALATARPKLIVLGTSFDEALIMPGAVKPEDSQQASDYDERLYVTPTGAPNPRMRVTRIEDAFGALFSLTALADSVFTVLDQDKPLTPKMTPLGFGASDLAGVAHTDGAYRLFIDKDRDLVTEMARWLREPRFDVEPLGRAIAAAQSRGAKVIVVVTPAHVDELEIYHRLGIMPFYEVWLNRLSEIVANSGATGVAPASLWDFNAPSQFTTEDLPVLQDTETQLRWFWEPIHFKPELGTFIISRILGAGPSDFGSPVTLNSLVAHEALVSDELRRYADAHPKEVARIESLVDGMVRAAP